jgi:L-asparaginase/Glu-tRNA(Gln) amidotransferase subunit D
MSFRVVSVAKVSAEQLFQVSSPDITVENWLTLAKRINQLLARDDVQGVVVTHGTDTMEETAYFLNLVAKSSKPVVLVGSMRGSKSPGADGPANLLNAVIVASSADAKAKGVLVTLNDRILAARDVTKTNTFTLDTFASPISDRWDTSRQAVPGSIANRFANTRLAPISIPQ